MPSNPQDTAVLVVVVAMFLAYLKHRNTKLESALVRVAESQTKTVAILGRICEKVGL